MDACDRLAGRAFRRPDTGDVLSFGAKTAEWRRATGVRSMEWTCFDGKIAFRDGATTSEGGENPAGTRLCWEAYCYDAVPGP